MVVRIDGGQIGNTGLYHEIGRSYLYIRGDCRYWVLLLLENEGWYGERTGVLTDEEAAELAAAMGYRRWPALQGVYKGWTQEPLWVFSDGAATVQCEDGCVDDSYGTPEIRGWTDAARDWWLSLYETGDYVPIDDPMRVDLSRFDDVQPPGPGDPPCLVEWPFSIPPDDVVAGSENLNATATITDPALAAEFRSYWRGLLEDPDELCSLYGVVHRLEFHLPGDLTTVYGMYMRDTVPFENEDGHVPVPVPTKTYPMSP